MSELCKYDEQVLDYLYGELAGTERAAFADHLSGCPSCRRELDSLSGVRKEVAELPRPVLATDAAARMTAQLMEAAIAATKATTASPALGGGKLLQFPSGRIKRALTHPVSAGILVAAAALFIVVFRLREPAEPVSDSPVPAPAVVAKQAPAKAPSPAAAPADVPALPKAGEPVKAAELAKAVEPAGATTRIPIVTTVTEQKPAEPPKSVVATGSAIAQKPMMAPAPKRAPVWGPAPTGSRRSRGQ